MSQRPGGGQSTLATPGGSRNATLIIAGAVALACLGAAVRFGPGLTGGVSPLTSAVGSPSAMTFPSLLVPTPQPGPSVEPTADPRPATTDPLTAGVLADRGPRTYRAAKVSGHAAGRKGRVIRFDVRVEKGVPVDPAQAATLMQQVLNDRRSWRGAGQYRFQVVASSRRATLHAYIVTPKTTDRLCAPLLTQGQVSCQNGNKVVLNATRWLFGADAYGADVTDYRRYLINHEFGHSLGHQHVSCKGPGKRASVMMQQTKGLHGCRANGWPYPDK